MSGDSGSECDFCVKIIPVLTLLWNVEVLGVLTLTLPKNILAMCLAQSPSGKSNFLSFLSLWHSGNISLELAAEVHPVDGIHIVTLQDLRTLQGLCQGDG